MTDFCPQNVLWTKCSPCSSDSRMHSAEVPKSASPNGLENSHAKANME